MTPRQTVEKALGAPISRETFSCLEVIVNQVIAENAHQNLISAKSVDAIWLRHVADSIQLLRYADRGPWLDLGTGAGFPGLIIGATVEFPVHLCEKRRRRAAFLDAVSTAASLGNVTVHGVGAEALDLPAAAVISARAFAPLDTLLAAAHRFSTDRTIWVLPKGRMAAAELESVRQIWQGDFRLEPSLTDPDSHIIVATQVHPRTKR